MLFLLEMLSKGTTLLGNKLVANRHKLFAERGIGFEEVCLAIQNGYLLAVVHGKKPKYVHQRIFVVFVGGYTYAVPFVEDEDKIFLKTIYPSRALHKKYKNEVLRNA